MKHKIGLAGLLAALLIALQGQAVFAAPRLSSQTLTYPNGTISSPVETPAEEKTLTITSLTTGKVITDTVYNILCMVTEAEVGSGFAPEAIKAQAIAAHSYILYHLNRGETVTCPTKTPGQRVKDCVAEVVNLVAYYNGKVAETVYARSSGGGTQSSADCWGGKVPYLQAADSPYDIEYFTRTVDIDFVMEWFPEANFTGDPSTWFEVLETNSTGFALKVRAGDYIYTGSKFVSKNHITLNSNKITDITYDPETELFTFTVCGWGHGVGLSQLGANGYAKKENRDYKWILSHYYAGITLREED
jgi:stage II sporulation protein D